MGRAANTTRKATLLDVDGLMVQLTRKRVRNVNLRVRRDGAVCVSAPARVPQSEIERFVRSKRDWIEQALARQSAQVDCTSLDCSEGASVWVWGRRLTCSVVDDSSLFAQAGTPFEIAGDSLLAYIDQRGREDDRAQEAMSALFASWLKQRLSERIQEVLPHWEEVVGAQCSAVRIRAMSSRWGSCNVKTRVITLNAHLVHYDPRCLDQVICHELCHLHEPSHNAHFHALMDRCYPDWRGVRALLRDA